MKRSTAFDGPALFVDTWGWVALADRKDPAHARSTAVRRQYSAPGSILTTDYVIDETLTILFARCPFPAAERFSSLLMGACESGQVTLARVTPERFGEAYRLRLRLKDKPRISFTDLTSFVVMRELGVRDVLTGDAHFSKVPFGFRVFP
jgi:predicted nucleic acid-binding protein